MLACPENLAAGSLIIDGRQFTVRVDRDAEKAVLEHRFRLFACLKPDHRLVTSLRSDQGECLPAHRWQGRKGHRRAPITQMLDGQSLPVLDHSQAVQAGNQQHLAHRLPGGADNAQGLDLVGRRVCLAAFDQSV